MSVLSYLKCAFKAVDILVTSSHFYVPALERAHFQYHELGCNSS